jgi:hypothetical protein
MKQFWPEDDLAAFFTLTLHEKSLLANKSAPMKIGFAVLVKLFIQMCNYTQR